VLVEKIERVDIAKVLRLNHVSPNGCIFSNCCDVSMNEIRGAIIMQPYTAGDLLHLVATLVTSIIFSLHSLPSVSS
jgi:hypothetical protein